LLALAGGLASFVTPALAQQDAAAPGSSKPKPRIPPAQAKALDDWSYDLAVQAATWGSPAVIMYALRDNDATGPRAKAQPNRLWRMENVADPELAEKAGYVLPNLSTIYGFGFLDLRQEPVVLTVPDSRDAPTPWVLIQPRIHLPQQSGLEAARKVLAGIVPQTLSEYLGKPAMPAPKYNYATPDFVNPKLPVSSMDFRDPLQFWDIMSAVINENPPPADQISALLPMFAALGIELGKTWDRSKVDPIVLKAMARAAEGIPDILAEVPFGRLTSNGWNIPPPTMGVYGTNYEARAWVARDGLTANTPKEATYFVGQLDSADQPLTGAKSYTITFKQTPPFHEPAFWALRMFDATNYYPVPNPINRYVLGSDYPDMKRDQDGSLTIYLQNENPGKDKEANWLPAPKGLFLLIVGVYAPGEAIIESLANPNAYIVPAVVAVK
jgi:hypothetical protein